MKMQLEVTLKISRFRNGDDDLCTIDLYEEECRAAQVNNSTNN